MNNTVTFAIDQKRMINETFIANASTFGNIKAAYLPASALFVDEKYQRKPHSKIAKIASTWDDNKCGFLEVSYRPDLGMFAIIDGQNRYAAGKMAGRDRFPCHIIMDIDVVGEAQRFASQDDNKVRVSPFDKFNAKLFAGDPDAIKLKMVCDKYNIKIKPSATCQTGYLRSVTEGNAALRAVGEVGLSWIFSVIKESGWHSMKDAYCKMIMWALRSLYMNIDPDDHALVKRNLVAYFEKTNPNHVIAQSMIAFRDCNRGSAVARFVEKIGTYNCDVRFIEQKG